ncbi:hypothetical protein FOL47_008157 [Perkinsus chesapeaki]|uniref:Uncharacterized protein n=1 Tax=Perkinsus chesapeaki TaxID=330153 RepID=A0A7J6LGI6_PERCH|nr:hypothetical protein FOL47_008157 [Perkinsus chesapeaki]
MPCPFSYLPVCAAGIFGGAGVLAAVDERYWTYSATMGIIGYLKVSLLPCKIHSRSAPLLAFAINDMSKDKWMLSRRSMAYFMAGGLSFAMGAYLLLKKPWLRTAKNLSLEHDS